MQPVEKLVKGKKVIIYGDANMAENEMYDDLWEPRYNEEKVKAYGMDGVDCLKMIKRRSKSVVWINPIFRRDWDEYDDSETIWAISQEIPMHDLTVGGVKDAVKQLMRKR